MSQTIDITPHELSIVLQVLKPALPKDSKVWAFGSRAKHSARHNSDLDLAIDAGQPLDNTARMALQMGFEEAHLPYTVDTVDMQTVEPYFKEIIDQQKKPLPGWGNVPELRFPEFEGEWCYEKLSAVAEIYDGTHQTPKYTDDGVPFVSVENIEDIETTKKFISIKDYENGFKVKPRKNDILMTRITAGIIGSTALIKSDTPLAYYVSLALVRPKLLFAPFMDFRINTGFFKHELYKRIIHVAFPKKINLGDIKECAFSYPKSKSEQQKIADFLSSVDAKLAKLSRKKTLLEDYKRGLMQQIFSQKLRFKQDDGSAFPEWDETVLGNLAKITTGSSNREDSSDFAQYTFFDRSVDVRRSDKYLYDCTAIIVAGEGKDFVPRIFSGKFDLHQRAYAIMKFKGCIPEYIYRWLHFHRSHFLKFSVGSTMPSLRIESFTRFPVSVPCEIEQQKIADFLSSIDQKIDFVAKQIKQLEVFKKGLLQKLFV